MSNIKIKDYKTSELKAAMALKDHNVSSLAEKVKKTPQFVSALIRHQSNFSSDKIEEDIIHLLMPQLGYVHQISVLLDVNPDAKISIVGGGNE